MNNRAVYARSTRQSEARLVLYSAPGNQGQLSPHVERRRRQTHRIAARLGLSSSNRIRFALSVCLNVGIVETGANRIDLQRHSALRHLCGQSSQARVARFLLSALLRSHATGGILHASIGRFSLSGICDSLFEERAEARKREIEEGKHSQRARINE